MKMIVLVVMMIILTNDNDGSDNVMAMIAARSKGVNTSVAYINVDLNIT